MRHEVNWLAGVVQLVKQIFTDDNPGISRTSRTRASECDECDCDCYECRSRRPVAS